MGVASQNNDGLMSLISAVNHDHVIALQSLAIVRLVQSSVDLAPIVKHGEFLGAVRWSAEEALIMSLWRMFDPDPKSAGLEGVCQYAAKNPQEFTWLNSAEGKGHFPDSENQIATLCKYWSDWRRNESLTGKITPVRHQFVGHRGLKPALGKSKQVTIFWTDILSALEGTSRFINEFSKFVDDASVIHSHIYDQVVLNGAFVIASAERTRVLGLETSDFEQSVDLLHEEIINSEKTARQRDGWNLS